MNSDKKAASFHFAAQDGNLVEVQMLVESGVDVNILDEDVSFTPLHHALKAQAYLSHVIPNIGRGGVQRTGYLFQ